MTVYAMAAVPDAGDYVRVWGIVLIVAAVLILAAVFIIKGVRKRKDKDE